MFSSSRPGSTSLTCGFKVNTNSPEWHKSMTKILKKIKGGNFWIDVDEGMAYVTGQGDPNKLLKLMGSKRGKDAEMAFVRTGTHHPQHHHHHDPNFYNNCQNSYFGQWPGYYPPGSAMQPYHHQYPFSGGYNNYGYY
ncbi:hypothetical protein ISN45_Aa05g019470 [Arabidopsis thaliana x Arabidopsis arenosa]|uniref:Metal ion binding protein n=2 Tax=Arabidopsis TaxID=3701 RepID=A0A8T2A0I8_ARASU|nr:hypothetical protein ISN45_Aa05g019470 [Arabidopsis thaliana x Arabidopsis arenosa]KAG7565239.1 hypothetical protein ISN44_As10g019530 [Arabidopsis suecica]